MRRLLIPLGLALAACPSPQTTPDSGTPDAGKPDSGMMLGDYDPNTCAHLHGGPAGAHTKASDLGRAFSLIRHFSTQVDTAPADTQLTTALAASETVDESVAAQLAMTAPDVCSAPAQSDTLGAATVTMRGTVAVVVPGTGPVPDVPSTAKAVAIDVRQLPDGQAARDALIATVKHVVSSQAPFPDRIERLCNGLPDEVYAVLFGGGNIYACNLQKVAGDAIAGQGPAVPLAVLTAPQLTPNGALAAVALKATANAFIIGENVPTAIAESTWVGVGSSGLAVRTGLLQVGMTALPDLVSADQRTADPLGALDHFDFTVSPGGLLGSATRTPIVAGKTPTVFKTASTTAVEARGALIGTYAAVRTFWPYFDVVGDVIDARLDECLGLVAGDAGTDRAAVRLALHRFGEALHDGHYFLFEANQQNPATNPPVAFIPSGTDVVVALSLEPTVHPGDLLIDVNGTPVADLITQYEAYASGSPQRTLEIALLHLVPNVATPASFQGADGGVSQVTLMPTATYLSAAGMFARASGPLTDLDAGDIEYVNLDAEAIDAGIAGQAIADIPGKRGVVLDMRGYPTWPISWSVLAAVMPQTAFGPNMALLNVTATSRTVVPVPTQYLSVISTQPQVYTGPVVLLVGDGTQSQAEHLTFFFKSLARGKVIGGKTSGADGNISGAQVPGGYGPTFTGTQVTFPDGGVFHARGITPDVEIYETADDLRAGRDAVLLRALQEIP
jgi:hypothetical protein